MKKLAVTLIRTAPLIHRVPTVGGVLKRIKYCLRGLAFASSTQEWFDLLETPELAVIVKNQPRLFHKLQRPYLNRTLSTRQRLEALKQHYRFVTRCFSTPAITSVYATPGLLLATLALEEVGHFELLLSCSHVEKEGELSIGLVNKSSGKPLFRLSFSVWKDGPDGREIYIGGLQGHKTATREMVVAITRGLYGLRPKALLVFALQQLAAGWGITSLRAVSDDMHIYRHFQKRLVLSASYDEFWIECGGRRAADGMFDLPVTFIPLEISTIKVNKRQMYKRRYAMLAGIANQINRNWQANSSGPAGQKNPDDTNAEAGINTEQQTPTPLSGSARTGK